MAPQSVFEQKETKLRIRGISYCEISLGGFVSSRLETRLIYRYLSNKPGGSGGRLICPASVC